MLRGREGKKEAKTDMNKILRDTDSGQYRCVHMTPAFAAILLLLLPPQFSHLINAHSVRNIRYGNKIATQLHSLDIR